MLVKQRQCADFHDIKKYVEHCQNGTIYEYMREEIERMTGRRSSTRKELKTIIFTVLFSNNRFIGQPEAEPKRIFKQIFPWVYEVFRLIKTRDSTLLPILLQRIESTLILDRIARRLTKEFPKKPIYTIHDSIATTGGNDDEIIAILKEEMRIATGLECQVRVEVWG